MMVMATRRVVHVVAVLLVVSFSLTFMLDLAPGDPAFAIFGDGATPEQIARVHADLHLDDPFYERYWRWLTDVVRGDFGTSYRTKESVTDLILSRLPVSAELVVLTLLLSLGIAVPIGVVTAYRADGRIDRLWSMVSSVLIGIPSFVSALLLVYVFAIKFREVPPHVPVTGWRPLSRDLAGNLRTALLPSLTLTLLLVPQFARLLRADMIATLQEDFIGAAKAKGVPTRRILLRHALRPSSSSLLTLAGISIGALIGGSVVVASLFALPGLGQALYQAVLAKDVLVVQGIVMFIAVMYVAINAAVDLLHGYLDPRTRGVR